ncbi:hypothetical protein F938_00805 [Acinetobacter bereziniae LMG 1003 = CIP 70.12]|uniref:Uncharacterized protein n=1 Tax=Acinetobacter bereziniae LMG 1003 = CIP 70.12 TaxID=981324 RepID=N9F5G2_ACIBZ|nr:hypothetical protein [Acinetobacter bereziniae]ENW00161.1 hypothetical protein F938_00805 [Acinetobacter bereziniae LMG 1003 = CIP 70.12]
MCNGGVISSVFSGVEGIVNAGQADAISKGNAKTVRSVAKLNSKKILEQGNKDASSARAAAAENGLNVDVGTAANIQDQILGDAAYNSTMNLSDSNWQANQIRQQGKMQRNSYGMKSASSFIDAGSQAMGWK